MNAELGDERLPTHFAFFAVSLTDLSIFDRIIGFYFSFILFVNTPKFQGNSLKTN